MKQNCFKFYNTGMDCFVCFFEKDDYETVSLGPSSSKGTVITSYSFK